MPGRLNPGGAATGIEPSCPAFSLGPAAMRCGILPVSPGCHAADSAFALSSVNDRLPHPRIPLRLDGVSWASSMGAYYWAWIRSRRAEAL